MGDYKDSNLLITLGVSTPTIECLKAKHFLGDYLHPTLIEMADHLEFSILRLRFASEMLLNRYGDSVSERQNEIHNLGETVMQNFAMFASLGRASRSYCIGLRYGVYETVAAGCLVQANAPHILKMALDIKQKQNSYHDLYANIAENALKRYRNQSIPLPSVLQSGVIRKAVK